MTHVCAHCGCAMVRVPDANWAGLVCRARKCPTHRRAARARVARDRAPAEAATIAAVLAAFPDLAGVGVPAVDREDDYGDVVFRDADGRPVAMVRPLPDGGFERVFG